MDKTKQKCKSIQLNLIHFIFYIMLKSSASADQLHSATIFVNFHSRKFAADRPPTRQFAPKDSRFASKLSKFLDYIICRQAIRSLSRGRTKNNNIIECELNWRRRQNEGKCGLMKIIGGCIMQCSNLVYYWRRGVQRIWKIHESILRANTVNRSFGGKEWMIKVRYEWEMGIHAFIKFPSIPSLNYFVNAINHNSLSIRVCYFFHIHRHFI